MSDLIDAIMPMDVSTWLEKVKMMPIPTSLVQDLCAEVFPAKIMTSAVVTEPPKPLTDEEVKERALIEVNAIRTEYGKPALSALPKGYRRKNSDCVVARALSDLGRPCVCGREMRIGGHVRPVPPVIAEFINRFDTGAFPELAMADDDKPSIPLITFTSFAAVKLGAHSTIHGSDGQV